MKKIYLLLYIADLLEITYYFYNVTILEEKRQEGRKEGREEKGKRDIGEKEKEISEL